MSHLERYRHLAEVLLECKIWSFHGGDYEQCRLLEYKNPEDTIRHCHRRENLKSYIKTQFVPHRRHYVSATEPSRLILCKIWGFHGCDNDEFLLGYKNPVRTSHETHYVSATEPSRLMLCNIWSFRGLHFSSCSLTQGKTLNLQRTIKCTLY
jgi:hypothetical protein